MLPEFNAMGLLPPGDYQLTLSALRDSRLCRGGNPPTSYWDKLWRTQLVDNLAILVAQLWQVGVDKIFINGSFVEKKDHPNDIDGYFVCSEVAIARGELVRELNLLDPWKVWTWAPDSRKLVPGFPKAQLPMWRKYRVELFPHIGQGTGIIDKHGHELEFPAAFRQSRNDGEEKGIIQIIKDKQIS
jgi:hypothetical protein